MNEFHRLREANSSRADEWHRREFRPWTGGDLGNAAAGEMGEACNLVKMLRRLETLRVQPPNFATRHEILTARLAEELADTILYIDLLADHYGVDLWEAITSKFNRVSVREGFPHRLDDKAQS